jgi:hypothetical protein
MNDQPDPTPVLQPCFSIGGRDMPILDPLQVIAVSADLIVEAREASGIVALGFATFYATGNSPGAATDLRTMLDSILKGAMAPKGEAH